MACQISTNSMLMNGSTMDNDLEGLDLMDLITLGDDWGVDLQGLKTDNEFRERLQLHKRKEANNQFFKFDPERFKSIRQEYENKTTAMIELFKNVRTSMGSSLNSVSSILRAGDMSDDLSLDFDQHITDLQSRECCVVFAGETSSGKSSLLNIVLGMDVLPTHTVSCTFIICKLIYAESFGSKIIYNDGITEEFQYESSEDAKQSLNAIIFEKNQATREESSRIQELVIYLPAVILQSGITIVDTPGFGENSELNSTVAQFIASSTITGFIYLVRTDIGGGVEEDRLLDFLREVKRLRSRNSMSRIGDAVNPSGSMFICNRWDIVRDDEKDTVKANAISKLTDAWPGLLESQIIFFSTEDAAMHVKIDRDYITQNFANLLKKIVKIIQTALNTRIKQHFRWLKRILQQTTNHVVSMVSQINKSNDELNNKFIEARKKIEQLNDNANETVRSLNQSIETESEKLLNNIKSYLKTPDIRQAIHQWRIDCSDLSESRRSTVLALKSSQGSNPPNSYEAVALRYLIDEIDNWIKDNKYDERMISTLEQTIYSKFDVLKDEMADINDEMTDGNSLSSHSSCSTLPEDELVEMLTSVKKAHRKKLKNKIEDIAQGSPDTSVILMPKVLIARAILSTMNFARGGRRTSAYTNDPVQYVKDKAKMFLTILSTDKILLPKLCTRYTETLRDYVVNIEKSIPRFIAANQKLMEEITSSRKMTRENKDALTETIKKLDSVRELLRGFQCFYVRDLNTESFKLPETDTLNKLSNSSRESLENSFNNSSGSHGVNCISFCGQLGTGTLSEKDNPICIMSRISNFDLEEYTVFKETSRLRSIDDNNVAPFLGTVRHDKKAVYMFAGNLRSIHRYLQKPHLPDVRGLTVKVIKGIVNGLAALHRRDLVHMELTPQTIMIDSDDEEVKLFGGCLPQHIPSLENNDSEKVGFVQYLSPDVLRDNLYSKPDDIYSLALVIWRLVTTKHPFHEKESLDRATFISQLNPESMLKMQDDWPEKLQDLFVKTLFSKAEDRLTIDQVEQILSEIELSEVICEETQTRRRNVFSRSSRSQGRRTSSIEEKN